MTNSQRQAEKFMDTMESLILRYHIGKDEFGQASWDYLANLVKDLDLKEVCRVIDTNHAMAVKRNLTPNIYTLVEKEKAELDHEDGV